MKIGILTFHRAHNYGAVLQAYALQEVLSSMGHTVKFIDYRNNDLLEVYKILVLRRFVTQRGAHFIKELKILCTRFQRSNAFNRFIDNYLHIEQDFSSENLNLNYDFIFVGSDQVWNFHLTKGFDHYYWGLFKQVGSKLKIVSYAASMEVANLSAADKNQIELHLRNFSFLSVREDSLMDSLKPLTTKMLSVVTDPTLLLGTQLWAKIAVKPNISKPYLLLYQVRANSKNEELAKRISKELNLDLIFLSARIDEKNSKVSKSASPAEYLGLFKNASFVLCSSFHGTVFSILFKVPFYSIMMNDGKDSRSISLLKSLDLMNRSITYEDKFINDPIDWIQVESRLDEVKKISIEYIKESLQ